MLTNFSSYSRMSSGLNKMKKPFYALSIIIFILVLISCILRSARVFFFFKLKYNCKAPITVVSFIPVILNGTVSLGVGIFFSVTGYSVLKSLRQSDTLSKSKMVKRV
jgi:O-antigen/teichoic acid export membrane protein